MEEAKTPLMEIYKQKGELNADYKYDCKDYELYGFLKFVIKKMENDLKLVDKDNERD